MNNMNVSPSARGIINAVDEWLKDSSKTSYRFELEEQFALEKLIKVIDNQINMLVDYETKNKKKEG